MPQVMQEQVRQRANFLCEYCHASERWQYVQFTVDHFMPITLGGANDIDNLALACFPCNRRKSNHLTAVDPLLAIETALFNPRRDRWQDHFIWSVDGLMMLGLTPTGRATVDALLLNRDRLINIRAADRDIGRHPPVDDPRLEA